MSGDSKEGAAATGARASLPIVGQGASDALERLLAGDSAAVINALKEQLQADPDNAAAWLRLGACYERIGHMAEAAHALARAVELDGAVLPARRMYARVLGTLQRYDEAVFQMIQARRLAPQDAQVQRELAIAFYDKGLFDKALRELDKAQELAPEDGRVRFAQGLAQEAKGDIATAIGRYREAVALSPQTVEYRQTLADALAAIGEMAQAMMQLQEAIQLDRNNPQLAMNLDVLRRGLAELVRRRLLGKREEDVDRSAMVQEGQLKRRLKQRADDGRWVLCYAVPLAEMWIELDAGELVTRLALVLPDPERAAHTRDEVFRVTVLGDDGQSRPADYATAVTLTFLREAIGCPMTRASALYAELLSGAEGVEWGGAALSVGEVEIGGEARMGVFVRRPPSTL